MKTLPHVIVALDGSLGEAGRFELVPAQAGVHLGLKERDRADRRSGLDAGRRRDRERGGLLRAELDPVSEKLPRDNQEHVSLREEITR